MKKIAVSKISAGFSIYFYGFSHATGISKAIYRVVTDGAKSRLFFSDLLVHVPDEKTFFDSRAWEHYFLTPAGRVYLSELDGYVGPIYRD
jgi:hypothetical protein